MGGMMKQFGLMVFALALAMVSCGQQPTAPKQPFGGTIYGTVAVDFDQNSARARFTPSPKLQTQNLNVSINFNRKFSGAFDDDSTKTRYAWATFETANTSANNLQNLTLVAVNMAGQGLGLTPIRGLENLNGQPITNPAIAQSIRPMHGISVNGTALEVDPNKADFQGFSETEAQGIEDAARTQSLLAQLDDVLEYGFVARNGSGGRGIAASSTGQVTVALRMPKPLSTNDNPYRFQMTFLLVDMPTVRVTRTIEESTAQVTARATALNASEVVLIGSDTDTVAGRNTIRLSNARVSSSPQFYIPSQALSFSINSPIGVIPSNQCTTLTALASDGGSLGSGVIWSMTGQGVLSNQTGTSATFCAPDVATTAAVQVNAVMRDDNTKTSTLGLSLQAPASVGVATLNVGGTGEVVTNDNSIRVSAANGAFIQGASVTVAKFVTPLFAPPEDNETIGESITVQIPKDSLNPSGLTTTIDIRLNPNLVLAANKTSFAEVRVVLPNNQELPFQTPIVPSNIIKLSPRVLWLIAKNYPSMTTITLKIAIQQSTESIGLLSNNAIRPQAFISQTGLYEIKNSISLSVLESKCAEKNVYDIPNIERVSGSIAPRSDGKIPLILVHGWLGLLALDPTKISHAYNPTCGWKDFIKYFYENLELKNRYTLYSYTYESATSWVVDSSDLFGQTIQSAFGNQPISMVAHSMGGLVARYYMTKNPTTHNVKQLITLGTPFAGVVPLTCTGNPNYRCNSVGLNYATEAESAAAYLQENPAINWAAQKIVTLAGLGNNTVSVLAAHTTLYGAVNLYRGTKDLAGNYSGFSTPYILNSALGNWDELNDRIFAIYACNPPSNVVGMFYLDAAIRRTSSATCTDGIVTDDSATYHIATKNQKKINGINHLQLTEKPEVFTEIQKRLTNWFGPVRAFTESGSVALADMVSKGSSLYVLGYVNNNSFLPESNEQSDGTDVFVAKITNGKLDWQKTVKASGNQFPSDIFLSEEIDSTNQGNLIVVGTQSFSSNMTHTYSIFALKVPDTPTSSVTPIESITSQGGSAFFTVDPNRKRIYMTGSGQVGIRLDPATSCNRYYVGFIEIGSGNPSISANNVENRCSNDIPASINIDSTSIYLSLTNGLIVKENPDTLFSTTVQNISILNPLSPPGNSISHFLNQNGDLVQSDVFSTGYTSYWRLSKLDPNSGNISEIRLDILTPYYIYEYWNRKVEYVRNSVPQINARTSALLIDTKSGVPRKYLGNSFSVWHNSIKEVRLESGETLDTFNLTTRGGSVIHCAKIGIENQSHAANGTYCASVSNSGIDVFRMKSGSTPN
jgi:pimeloyl-ACP methyl ester carboxylesterase